MTKVFTHALTVIACALIARIRELEDSVSNLNADLSQALGGKGVAEHHLRDLESAQADVAAKERAAFVAGFEFWESMTFGRNEGELSQTDRVSVEREAARRYGAVAETEGKAEG